MTRYTFLAINEGGFGPALEVYDRWGNEVSLYDHAWLEARKPAELTEITPDGSWSISLVSSPEPPPEVDVAVAPRQVQFFEDCGAGPLWGVEGVLAEDPEILGISPDLAEELVRWCERIDDRRSRENVAWGKDLLARTREAVGLRFEIVDEEFARGD